MAFCSSTTLRTQLPPAGLHQRVPHCCRPAIRCRYSEPKKADQVVVDKPVDPIVAEEQSPGVNSQVEEPVVNGNNKEVDTTVLTDVLKDTAAAAVVGEPLARAAKTYRGERRALQAKAGRPLFYPSKRTLEYLDGSLPGDYGWDPLGLSDPKVQGEDNTTMNLSWLSYAELIHGRWAMLAALGALAPELMSLTGAIPPETGLPWFVAGGLFSDQPGVPAIPFIGETPIKYWGDNYTLFFTMFVAMAFAETGRWLDWKKPGSVGRIFKGLEDVFPATPHDPKYPGGRVFNFAGFGLRKPSEMRVLQTKEIKNGRLAMVAWLGFMSQAVVTRQGPVQNLLDHIADPANRNVAANVGNFILSHSGRELFPFAIWLVAGFAAGALYSYSLDHEQKFTGDKFNQEGTAGNQPLPGPQDVEGGMKDYVGAAVGQRDDEGITQGGKTRFEEVDGKA